MLRYEHIYEVSGARRRLGNRTHRRDPYAWRQDGRNRDQDQLALFTFETPALADSAHNLDFLLAQARGYNQRYVVLTDTKIQIAGEHDTEHVANAIAPPEWQRDFDIVSALPIFQEYHIPTDHSIRRYRIYLPKLQIGIAVFGQHCARTHPIDTPAEMSHGQPVPESCHPLWFW